MSPLFLVLLLFVLAVFVFVLCPLSRLVVSRFRSPLRFLPSPPSPSCLVGHLAQVSVEESNIFQRWTEVYGHTFTYRGFINGYRLITTDPLALAYILGHAYDFPKPDFITEALAEVCGGHEGLLTAQGDIHRRQVCLSLTMQPRLIQLFSSPAPHPGTVQCCSSCNHFSLTLIQNQAFSPSHIKSIMPIFREKAERVCIPFNFF